MSVLDHPSTSTRERAVPCTWCRVDTWNDSAVCCNVACQASERHTRRSPVPSPSAALAAGERVRCVGLHPRPWETTGTVEGDRRGFVLVVWDSDPYAVGRPVHASQLEPTDAPPTVPCKHGYNVPLAVSVVPKGTPCAHCGEPYR